MKILLYGDYYRDASGFAKALMDLIPEFQKAGHEIAQVALRYNGLSSPKNETIKVYPTLIKGVRNHWAAEMLDHAMRDFEPDIVFSIHDYYPLNEITPVLSKPFKKPFKWIHWGVMDGEPFSPNWIEPMKWTHYNLYQANFTKNVVEKAIPKLRGETIYPAVDKKTFKPLDKKAVREKLGISDTFNIIFVGRNQYRKNIPSLLHAVKKLAKIIPDIRVVLHSIPTVTPDGLPNVYDIRRIAEDLGIEKYVAYTKGDTSPITSYAAINELYNAGDVLVLPTMGEGFGLPLTEAMAAGLPVIGTDCSAVTEVVGDRGLLVKIAGYVYVEMSLRHAIIDVDDLAQCIYRMSGDKALRENCIKKGQKFTDTLTPDKVSKRILDIFEKVIKEDYQPLALED